ncbi:acyloxyacyl hydrolase [Pinibacter aurantiacus]|uniref:Acyloxyacyl hydrolase n=1 Tax=Pinibacter aurantiacus TaxID=2851599 RepID=A0A9E2W107_9BACT|nr:acyloxyacyl hydrolase [Pinibacter aurantiacus]MBV4355575.1 acyloxyacyl hydrolase [Pinibacter aurantiacus]
MKYLLTIIAALTFYTALQAQQTAEFSYQVSFPTGDFKDFVSKTSWVGFSGAYRHRLKNPQLSLGGAFTWFYFQDKKGVGTFPTAEGTVHGNRSNYTNIYQLVALVQYDFKNPKERVVPYVRVGVGGAYQDQRTDIGLYIVQSDGVQFAANADLGVRFNKDENHGIFIAATYNTLPAANGMIATSFFGVKLGISGWGH